MTLEVRIFIWHNKWGWS